MGIFQILQKFRVRYRNVAELTEVPGSVARAYRTHMSYKNDMPVPRVFVALAYRTAGHGYECPTELTHVLCRVIPGLNTPGTVCAYPTQHNLQNFNPEKNSPLTFQFSSERNINLS